MFESFKEFESQKLVPKNSTILNRPNLTYFEINFIQLDA